MKCVLSNEYIKLYTHPHRMKELLAFIKPYTIRQKRLFSLVTFFIIVSAVAQTFIPVKIKSVLDSVEVQPSQAVLLQGVLVILGLATFDLLGAVGMRYFNNRFSQNVLYDIRQDIFAKLQEQDLEFYATESIGQIMARTIEEAFMLNDLLRWGYRIGLQTALLFTGAIIAMWIDNPLLAFAVALLIPIILIMLSRTSKNNFKIFYSTRYAYGEMNSMLAENLSGIRSVKSFGRERQQIGIFAEKNKNFFTAAKKEIHIRSYLGPVVIYMIDLAILLILFIAGGLVRLQIVETSSFIAAMLLIFQIARPGRFLGELSIRLQMADTAAVRLNEIMKAPHTILQQENAIEFQSENPELTFDNVSFRYPNAKVNAVERLNFTIPHGQKVAILGATGSGKSTIINLIPRFFDPTEGSIKLNDRDIREYTIRSVRDLIRIVHQESFLFTLSIEENIKFGRPNATHEEVVAAAKAAQIHDTILSFKDGYDTIVGERGVTLSGGQKQRISISRALLTDPKILIFDDSVSAVDPETEAKIQTQLGTIDRNRTILVISQRPSSLQYVDRIIVVADGQIVQDGTHAELSAREGIYKNFLRAMQSQVKFIEWQEIGGND